MSPTSDPHAVPLQFPGWAAALDASVLAAGVRAAHAREIIRFLRHGRERHAPATVRLAQQYLAQGTGTDTPAQRGGAAGRRVVRSGPPPRAQDDLGASEWERELVAALRQQGLLWRTEQTYRAWAGRKVPTVLTRAELTGLFGQLEGTTRLMAELAYGAGLRLMELLRLRVHHLDLARGQLQIYDGKGAKHRVTVLPAVLVPALSRQLVALQHLHAEDRAAGLPGVWLPEGLAVKYRRAGEQFEWQWLFPSRETSVDPVTGLRRRHHVSDALLERE